MRNRTYGRRHVVFLVIAVALMLVIDRGVTYFTRPAENIKTVPIEQIPAPVIEKEKPVFGPPLELSTQSPLLPPEALEEPAPLPAWQRHAVPSDAAKDKPRVVVIIDDMGLNRQQTRHAMDLPGPLTFAFLPYADDLPEQTAMAKTKGHELIVHVPMEPMNSALDAGPEVLKASLPEEEFLKILERDLASFEGYVGINNHMGSAMTQDPEGMKRLMAELKKRGLLFIDSRTIGTSVAEEEAKKAGIPYAGRDVFLDHEETYEAASGALQELEETAMRNGIAIAIGHPKAETLKALREWLPTLAGKGITLVPVSAAVTVPENNP